MTQSPNLILEQMEIGPMQNFQYFLGDKSTKEIAVVDPAWDVDLIRSKADARGYQIKKIFLTHGHMDHVNGLDELLSTHDVPVYISEKEADAYMPRCKNLKLVKNGTILMVGKIKFECIHTPGHTPGGLCFKHEDDMIVGDTMFIDGCGRCDLPGSDAHMMYDSLYNILMKLPDTTMIYPGHDYGPTSSATLGEQKKTNPYLNCHNINEFLQHRMGIVS